MAPRTLTFISLLLLAGCKGESLATEWCSALVDEPDDAVAMPTWKEDIEPLVRKKCLGCHTPGGLAPLDLGDFAVFNQAKASIRHAVESRRMPPFLADGCCTSYLGDRSLSPEEVQRITRFIDQGLPEGDPSRAPPEEPTTGVLSRVDVSLAMPGEYTPQPPEPEATDDNRCFALEWPRADDGFITGLSVRPGNRKLVHHVVVAALEGEDAEDAKARDLADPLPGFDCNGGLGRFQKANPIGGAVVGNDLPRGLGSGVKQGSVILLNIHYSVARISSPESDLTHVDFKFDTQAKEAKASRSPTPRGWWPTR